MARHKAKPSKAKAERSQRRRQAVFSGATGALSSGAASAFGSKVVTGKVRPRGVITAAIVGGALNARASVNNVRRAQGYTVRSRHERVVSGNTARYTRKKKGGGGSRQRRNSKGEFA